MAGGGDIITIRNYNGSTTLYGSGVNTSDTIGDILGLSWNSGGAVTALAISIGGTPLPNNTIIANSGAYDGGGEWIFYDVTPQQVETVSSFYLDGTQYNLGGSGGGEWGTITGTLSNQTDLNTALGGKQDTLVSGTNIKTINGSSILGSGDLTVGTDYSRRTKSGASFNLDLRSKIEPSANFTVNLPSSIKDGEEYVLRCINGATTYTMTLGTGFTNPRNVDLTLSSNATDQFVFLAIGGELELQPLVATGS